MAFELNIKKEIRDRCGGRFMLESSFCTDKNRVVLFGPSGSGKTLTLSAIAGLLRPDSGYIRINGRTLVDTEKGVFLKPSQRNIGLIFQDYSLFPHMTVRQNVAYGLKSLWRRLSPEDNARVDELLDIFGLTRLANSRPDQISGGQKQRTALARGIAVNPDLLLLDEPFSALDRPLRLRMYGELSSILASFNLPLVMVTHDPDEVEYFADTVVVYESGRVAAVEEDSGSGIAVDKVYQAVSRAYCSP